MFRKFLVFFLSIVAASAIGAGAGIGIWEATDDDGATATVAQTAPTRSVADGTQLSVNDIYEQREGRGRPRHHPDAGAGLTARPAGSGWRRRCDRQRLRDRRPRATS